MAGTTATSMLSSSLSPSSLSYPFVSAHRTKEETEERREAPAGGTVPPRQVLVPQQGGATGPAEIAAPEQGRASVPQGPGLPAADLDARESSAQEEAQEDLEALQEAVEESAQSPKAEEEEKEEEEETCLRLNGGVVLRQGRELWLGWFLDDCSGEFWTGLWNWRNSNLRVNPVVG